MKAGISADKLYFHGNNKTPFELDMAVNAGVHAVVIDSFYEMELLENICAAVDKTVRALVRVKSWYRRPYSPFYSNDKSGQ